MRKWTFFSCFSLYILLFSFRHHLRKQQVGRIINIILRSYG